MAEKDYWLDMLYHEYRPDRGSLGLKKRGKGKKIRSSQNEEALHE